MAAPDTKKGSDEKIAHLSPHYSLLFCSAHITGEDIHIMCGLCDTLISNLGYFLHGAKIELNKFYSNNTQLVRLTVARQPTATKYSCGLLRFSSY
jgi:hypothetical protein